LNGCCSVGEAFSGQLAGMNANPFVTTACEFRGISVDADSPDRPSVDVAWCVLEAANDLGDVPTVDACRRVIDANLSGRLAMQSDIKIIFEYFK
jgi:hypothetical protein